MLRALYDRLLRLAGRPNAARWLALVSFIDGGLFTLPPELLQIPMSIARPDRAFRYALIGTVAAAVGGVMAYFIGATLFDTVATPLLHLLGKEAEFVRFTAGVRSNAMLWPLFYLLAPMPAAVAAGSLKLGVVGAVAAALVGRGVRYFIIAALLKRFGAVAEHYIEAHFHRVLVGSAVLFGAFVLVRYAL